MHMAGARKTTAKISPEDPLVLLKVFGFLFRVWIPSFFMASGRGTWMKQERSDLT